MVDPDCPWWAKLRRAESLIDVIRQRFRGAQQSRGGWEIVRETLMRPWSTGSGSLSRSRPTSLSWSATRSATCGRHSARLPISWPCSTLVRSARMRANDGVTDPHLRRAVRRLGVFEEQTDEAAPLGDLREAGFRTIRSGQPFVERLRRSANDRGGTPLADRRRLRGTTMSASSSTGCGMSTSTDAYLCWRPRLPAKAAARLAAWSSSPCRSTATCTGGGRPCSAMMSITSSLSSATSQDRT